MKDQMTVYDTLEGACLEEYILTAVSVMKKYIALSIRVCMMY